MNPETGWDPSEIRARFDCEKMRTWISVRTGGILEVYEDESYSEDEPYSQPAGDQKDSNHNSTFKSWYKNYSGWRVRFIHRTALTFVSETSTGKGLLSASRRSPAELPRICFECRFVWEVIFDALTVKAENKDYWLVSHCFDDNVRQSPCVMPPQSIGEFERACNGLLAKGYLLLNEFYLTLQPRLPNTRLTFPSSDGRTIDYCCLYCIRGLWEHVQHGLAERCNDVDHLSILLACTIAGVGFLDRGGTALFIRLIKLGADPCRQITFDNGESLWLLPLIAERITNQTPTDICQAILPFDLSYPLKNLPPISSCNEIWWARAPERRYFWGDYRTSNMKGLFESQDTNVCVLDPGSSRAYVCCDVDYYRELRLFAVGSEESCKILESVVKDLPSYRSRWYIGHVVIDIALPDLATCSGGMRPLNSLFDAMVYMGKSEDSIRKWAADEERRLRQSRVDQTTIDAWKSWFFGSDIDMQPDEDSETGEVQSRSLWAVSDTPQSLQPSEHHSSNIDLLYAPDHGTAVSEQEAPTTRSEDVMDGINQYRSSKRRVSTSSEDCASKKTKS